MLAQVAGIEAVCARHGVSLAAAALHYALGHPAIAGIVAGQRTPEEVDANLAWLAQPIPAGFWDDLVCAGLVPIAPAPSLRSGGS